MRVLIVNTSESKGGAAVAAKRLTQALINHGVKAKMLVCEKQTDAVYVAQYGRPWRHRLAFLGERIGIWMNNLFSRKHLFEVSTADWGVDITHTEEFREADIIHLHWVNQGMLSLAGVRKILRSGKPVVWTMHDMWPCTAICHHAHQCNRFQESCGQCLFLRFPREHDLSYRVFRKKKRVLQEGSLHMVAVSSWLAERAATSALLKGREITVIPNSLSLERFRLLNRTDMRSLLHLSSKYIIAFGAARIDTPIKGFTYLKQALAYMVEHLHYRREDLTLVLFGGVKDKRLLDDMPTPYIYMGMVKDEDMLSRIYAAANVLVSSSLYETFGQTLIEAQACGCVPVSFNNSGQTDIIVHKKNGYLADYLSVPDLARGIDWGCHAPIERRELRAHVLGRYSESKVAGRYSALYHQILEES